MDLSYPLEEVKREVPSRSTDALESTFTPKLMSKAFQLKGREEGSSVHESLYKDANRIQAKISALKTEEESKHTFAPDLSFTAKKGKVESRLFTQTSSSKAEELAALQMQDCTFQPDAGLTREKNARMLGGSKAPVVDLNFLQKRQEALAAAKVESELQGCSFAPHLVASPIHGTKSPPGSPHERLFSDSSRLREVQEQRKAQHEQQELKAYTFKPTIGKKAGRFSTFSAVTSVHERLYSQGLEACLRLASLATMTPAGCTFHPIIGRGGKEIRSTAGVKRLEEMHDQGKKMIETRNKSPRNFKQAAQDRIEEQELTHCTFQPESHTSKSFFKPANRDAGKPVFEQLHTNRMEIDAKRAAAVESEMAKHKFEPEFVTKTAQKSPRNSASSIGGTKQLPTPPGVVDKEAMGLAMPPPRSSSSAGGA